MSTATPHDHYWPLETSAADENESTPAHLERVSLNFVVHQARKIVKSCIQQGMDTASAHELVGAAFGFPFGKIDTPISTQSRRCFVDVLIRKVGKDNGLLALREHLANEPHIEKPFVRRSAGGN